MWWMLMMHKIKTDTHPSNDPAVYNLQYSYNPSKTGQSSPTLNLLSKSKRDEHFWKKSVLLRNRKNRDTLIDQKTCAYCQALPYKSTNLRQINDVSKWTNNNGNLRPQKIYIFIRVKFREVLVWCLNDKEEREPSKERDSTWKFTFFGL